MITNIKKLFKTPNSFFHKSLLLYNEDDVPDEQSR